MSDSDRDNDIESEARRRAEHDDRKRKEREDLAEVFQNLQRRIPRHYFKGRRKVSFDTFLEILADYLIDEKDRNKETVRRTRILSRLNKEVLELIEKIDDKLARGEKEEAKNLYLQHDRHVREIAKYACGTEKLSDESEDSSDKSEDSSDESEDSSHEENAPNAEDFQVELLNTDEEEEATDSEEETDD